MKTFKVDEAVAVTRERAQQLMRLANTFTKVKEVCARAEHPELGEVTVMSIWKNSAGDELCRVKASRASRAGWVYADETFQYVKRDVLTRLRAKATRARRRAIKAQQPRIKYSKSRALTAHLAF